MFFCKIVDILFQKLTSHCRTVLCVLRPASRIQKRISFASLILNFYVEKVSVSQQPTLSKLELKDYLRITNKTRIRNKLLTSIPKEGKSLISKSYCLFQEYFDWVVLVKLMLYSSLVSTSKC